jgi:hypothetical protein
VQLFASTERPLWKHLPYQSLDIFSYFSQVPDYHNFAQSLRIAAGNRVASEVSE